MFWIAIIALPLLAAGIDGAVGIYTRNRTYVFGKVSVDDFRILVPIWGRTSYLENVEYLSPYGAKVTLCTSGDESADFHNELGRIAAAHEFLIYIDQEPQRKSRRVRTHRQRATSGTIRDRIIRNVLAE